MNLYLISQSENNKYDTYDSAVVAAPDEETARNMNPWDGNPMTAEDWNYPYSSWCSAPDKVSVEYLGVLHKSVDEKDDELPHVICSSFHAG